MFKLSGFLQLTIIHLTSYVRFETYMAVKIHVSYRNTTRRHDPEELDSN
jgi:hypothetical protein